MPGIDLSFARYVAARKGQARARARDGAAYAYGGDLKVRSALARLRPVTLAVEATLRFWQSVGRSNLLGSAIRVGPRQFPRIHGLALRCAETLQIPMPAVYVTPDVGVVNAQTVGTRDDASIIISGALIDHLSETELLSVLGHECGHIHNDHTVYLTTLYFLSQAGSQLVRWAAKPAVLALNAWARRAEITCDRASLLCTRDLAASTTTLVKLAVGSKKLYSDINIDEYMQQLDEVGSGPGRWQELFATHPYLPKRVQALRLFARTTFFRAGQGAQDETPALTKDECDAQVAELLKVL